MKIFELAKQIGVSAGEITKAAKKMGMEKAGNFTSLSDTQARDLVAIVTGKASSKADAPKEPAPAPKPKVIEPEAPVAPPRVVGTPLKAVTAKENRDRLHDYLEQNGVGTVCHYPIAPHKQECYSKESWNTPQLSLPITERLADEELSLPIGPSITLEEVAEVVRLVNLFE